MTEQDPHVPADGASSPYRPRPEEAGAPPNATKSFPRGTIAAVVAIAAGAMLIPRFFAPKTPTLDDVPASLLRTTATFPGAVAELPPATPLAPLLAADQPDGLAVLEPGEGARRITRGGTLVVRFNRPMVRAAEVERPLARSPLRFSPAVRGSARWTTRSSIVFDADAATWDRQLETTLTVDGDLRALSGETMNEEVTRTIVFAGGTAVDPYAGNRRVLPGEPLKLYFRGPVDVATLTPMVMVYEIGGGQRTVPFTLTEGRRDEQGRSLVNVNLGRSLDPGSRVAVALAPAVYSTWEGAEAPGVVSYEFTPTPRFEGIGCPDGTTEASSCDFQAAPGRIVDVEDTLRLWATNTIATPLPDGAVTVMPPVTAFAVRVDGHELELSGEWEPGQVYQVNLGPISDTQGHVLGTPGPLAVRSRGRDPEVQTATGRLTFERNERLDLPFAAVHVDQGRAWYAPISPGQELRAALLLPEPGTRGSDVRWSDAALQPLVPTSRANHWGRGRYPWLDASAQHDSAMALVVFDPNGTDESSPGAPTFLQATDLGVSATALEQGVLVWASSLRTAEPVADAEVTLADRDAQTLATARTDASGVAWIPVAAGALTGRHAVRVAKGDDRAVMILDPSTAANPSTLGLSGDAAARPANAPVASVWADRGAYRPGEGMRVKAVLRTVHGDSAEAVTHGNVRVTLAGPDGEVATRHPRLSPFGTLDADFTLPPGAMLGDYAVNVFYDAPRRHTLPHNIARNAAPPQGPVLIGSASVRVGEFRQPTVRVDVTLPTQPVGQGDTLRAEVRGRYLFGAPTANTTARWSLLRDGAGSYATRWDPFTFSAVDASPRSGTADSGELTLDAEGHGEVSAHVALSSPQRERATVEVVVRDTSGQETSAWRTVTVFPAEYEVGLRKGPAWVERGAALDIDAVVIDHDDRAVAGRTIQARVLREGWHSYWEWSEHGADDAAGEAGAWQARRNRNQEVVHTCALTSADEPARCSYTPTRPGTYVLEVSTTDARGRRSIASRRLYVAGPGEHPDRDPPGAPVQVTPSKRDWFVGERARIAFECPWPEAEAQVTVLREGVIHTEHRRVQAGGVVMELPVTREMVPNAYVTVSLVRPRTGSLRAVGEFDLASPDLRWGATELGVRPQSTALRVDLSVGAESVRPDTDVPIDVTVRDGDGRPASAEVALYAVDEGTLRLTSYATPDPTSGLLPRRGAQFALDDLRRSLVSRVDFPALPGASGDGGEDDNRSMRDNREVFDPTPLWMPHLVTDAQGRVHATLHVPGRNTQYRVMAVAVDTGLRSGNASTNLTASRPVVMRPAFPRALTDGDHVEAAAFLHSASDHAVDATVTPVVNGERRGARTVHLEPGAEVRISEALDASGESVLVRFEVAADGSTDAAESRIPVAPRVRWSRAGTVGAVQRERSLTLDLPDDIAPSLGDVTLTVATHPFVGIDGAMEDLLDAPWGGTEALASSVLGWSALASLDVGLRPARWPAHEVRQRAETALENLAEMVLPNGSYGAWSSSDEMNPYLTVYVAHAVLEAERAGFRVPDGMRDRAVSSLASAIGFGYFSDGTYGTRDEEAFALRVLADARHPNGARVTALYELRDSLTPYGLAQLALAMESGDTRRETLITVMLRRAGALTATQFRDATGLRWYASSARTVGAMLEAVSRASSNTRGMRDLAGALLHLRVGHDGASWGAPHETAHALEGLSAYAKRFADGRTLDAAVLVDGTALRPHVRTARGARYVLPMRTVGTRAHRVEIRGEGAIFYALDTRWATPLGPAEEIARGRDVAVHRVFETENGAALAPGAHVHLGDLLRVRLYVYSEGNTAPFTTLRDPIGGGFEAVDQGFDTTPQSSLNALLGGGPDDGAIDPRGFYAMRSIDQISHRQFRRGMTSFYFNTGASGLREFTYAVRATSVGTFTVAPAQFEAIYQPTQIARSTAITLVVDP